MSEHHGNITSRPQARNTFPFPAEKRSWTSSCVPCHIVRSQWNYVNHRTTKIFNTVISTPLYTHKKHPFPLDPPKTPFVTTTSYSSLKPRSLTTPNIVVLTSPLFTPNAFPTGPKAKQEKETAQFPHNCSRRPRIFRYWPLRLRDCHTESAMACG